MVTGPVPQYTPTGGQPTNYSNITFSALAMASDHQRVIVEFLNSDGKSVETVTLQNNADTSTNVSPIPVENPSPASGYNDQWKVYSLSGISKLNIQFEFYDPANDFGWMPSKTVEAITPISYGTNATNYEMAFYLFHSEDGAGVYGYDYLDTQLMLFFS